MAIEFHCEHCGKLVRAGDEHAGKRGKCPGCHQNVYIPTPDDQLDPLQVAPLDDADESRQKQLLDESRDLAQDLMRDREAPPESAADTAPSPAPLGDARLAKAAMEESLVQYVQSMAKGDLSRAEQLAAEIRSDMTVAEEIMQRLTLDEIPPDELADIPRPVLVAFFKQLREKK
jgi:hypothetical protein